MPKIGDIIKGTEIGYKYTNKYILVICPDCKKERWVRLTKGKPRYKKCASCRQKDWRSPNFGKFGKDSIRWKGGRREVRGYILIWTDTTSPYSKMRSKQGYILEHRLVMARKLGRCLESWEKVHHIDMNNANNDVENLYIYGDNSEHQKGHASLYKIVANLLKRKIIEFKEGEYSGLF